jgi:aspartyl/asparaginyl-tRNA synthetase
MVHRYPTAVKAFYMKEDPTNPKRCLGVDVLAPEGYGERRESLRAVTENRLLGKLRPRTWQQGEEEEGLAATRVNL